MEIKNDEEKIKDQKEALRIIRWASKMVEKDQEDIDYNDLAMSCAELSDAARIFLEKEKILLK